jgi:hypothetical protein
MISTRPSCHTPTHEYVVPRSIPIARPRAGAPSSILFGGKEGTLGRVGLGVGSVFPVSRIITLVWEGLDTTGHGTSLAGAATPLRGFLHGAGHGLGTRRPVGVL